MRSLMIAAALSIPVVSSGDFAAGTSTPRQVVSHVDTGGASSVQLIPGNAGDRESAPQWVITEEPVVPTLRTKCGWIASECVPLSDCYPERDVGDECLRTAQDGRLTIEVSEDGCFSSEDASLTLSWVGQTAALRVNSAHIVNPNWQASHSDLYVDLNSTVRPEVTSAEQARRITGWLIDVISVPDDSLAVCTTQYHAKINWHCGAASDSRTFSSDCGGDGLSSLGEAERLYKIAVQLALGRDLGHTNWTDD